MSGFNRQKTDGGGLIGSNVYVANDDFYLLRGGNKQTDGNLNPTASPCFVRDATTIFVQQSAARTTSSNSGDLAVAAFDELAIDVNVTANTGTSPTIQFFLDRKGADGIYYVIWTSSTINTSTGTASTTVGTGCATNQGFGSIARLRWTIGGTSTPGFTWSSSIIGK